MYNHLMYFAYWVINSLVLYLASWILPENNVVLGNWRFSSIESSIYAGFWLTFLVWVFWDFAIAREFNLKKKMVAFGFFLIVNSISIWVISRFSNITGFELINYQWAFIIGFAATLLQRVPWRFVGPRG